MPKTFAQKIEALRLKSLRIVEAGLSDRQPPVVQFYNALQFLLANPGDANQEIPDEPDALDAEEIIEKGDDRRAGE